MKKSDTQTSSKESNENKNYFERTTDNIYKYTFWSLLFRLVLIVLFVGGLAIGLYFSSIGLDDSGSIFVPLKELETSSSTLAYLLGIPIALLSSFIAIVLAMNSHQLAKSQARTDDSSLKIAKTQLTLETNKLITDSYHEASVNYKKLIRHLGKIARIQLQLEEVYLKLMSSDKPLNKAMESSFPKWDDLVNFHSSERSSFNDRIKGNEEIEFIVKSMKHHFVELVELLVQINENYLSRNAWSSSYSDVYQQGKSIVVPKDVYLNNLNHLEHTPPHIEYNDLSSIISYIEYMLTTATPKTVLNSLDGWFNTIYQTVSDEVDGEDVHFILMGDGYNASDSSHVHLLARAGECFFFPYEHIYNITGVDKDGERCINTIDAFIFKTGQELFLKMLNNIPESDLIKEQIKTYMEDIGHKIEDERIIDVIDSFTKKDFFFFGENGLKILEQRINDFDEKVNTLNKALQSAVG